MMRILDAFKAFFAVLGGKEFSTFPPQIDPETPVLPDNATVMVAGDEATRIMSPTPSSQPASFRPTPSQAVQSEALTLLATLQRESRLVDFLMESLDGFSDAQVGAAARAVHDDAAKSLKRLFALRPLLDHPEGATVDIDAPDAARYTLSGKVDGFSDGSLRGTLVHAGWVAGCCELPRYEGSAGNAPVVAPAEIEVGS